MGISNDQLFPLVSKRPSDRRYVRVEDQRVKAVEKETCWVGDTQLLKRISQ